MKLDTKEFEARMKKSISVYEDDLDGIRVGRANPSLLAKINVDYYGSPTPINNVAEVKVTDARTIVIQPWEAKLLKDIGKAIQASDLGITPIDDGKVIRLCFPALNEGAAARSQSRPRSSARRQRSLFAISAATQTTAARR